MPNPLGLKHGAKGFAAKAEYYQSVPGASTAAGVANLSAEQ